MFQKLKQRWYVNGLDLFSYNYHFCFGWQPLRLCRQKTAGPYQYGKGAAMGGALYHFNYIALAAGSVAGKPSVGVCFLKNILVKIMSRIKGKKEMPVINIAIFASGAGSNAQQIINRFSGNKSIKVVLVVL